MLVIFPNKFRVTGNRMETAIIEGQAVMNLFVNGYTPVLGQYSVVEKCSATNVLCLSSTMVSLLFPFVKD